MENIEDYIKTDEEGNLYLKAINEDKMEVCLSRNGFYLTIKYLY